MSLRNEIISYISAQYGAEAEYPWKSYRNYCVFRRKDSGKWFAIIMDISSGKLGLEGEGKTDIIDLKTGPMLADLLRGNDGYLPAYQLNKGNCITVLLDGSVGLSDICALIDISYSNTGKRPENASKKERIRTWLVPANPKYYDLDAVLEKDPEKDFIWKQSSNINPGDTVYIYMAAPFSSIRYKCKAVETDIPYEYGDENVRMKKIMKLRMLKKYDGVPIDREMLRSHDVRYVRGPRSMPDSLEREIEELYPEK